MQKDFQSDLATKRRSRQSKFNNFYEDTGIATAQKVEKPSSNINSKRSNMLPDIVSRG